MYFNCYLGQMFVAHFSRFLIRLQSQTGYLFFVIEQVVSTYYVEQYLVSTTTT